MNLKHLHLSLNTQTKNKNDIHPLKEKISSNIKIIERIKNTNNLINHISRNQILMSKTNKIISINQIKFWIEEQKVN